MGVVYSMMRAEMIRLDQLQFWPRNPKMHDIGGLHVGFGEFGFVDRIIINETTGCMLSGHGRTKTLWQLYQAAITHTPPHLPPENIGIDPDDGMWTVPVDFITLAESKEAALVVWLNQSTISGGWDEVALATLLQEIEAQDIGLLHSTGFTPDDVEAMVREIDFHPVPDPLDEPPAETERADELRLKWKPQPGMIWEIPSRSLLGQSHRLMCGDSTSEAQVALLLGGVVPSITITDPPYGVGYEPEWRDEADFEKWGPRRTGHVINDDLVEWKAALKLAGSDVMYVWHASLHSGEVFNDLQSIGYEIRSNIIWVKPHFAISRGHYHWQHEPCWYAVKKGATAHWAGDRKQTTVWQFPPVGTSGSEAEDASTKHGTQKPLEAMRRPLLNHTKRGDSVYDPFVGAGTTLAAAEQCGRVGYAMDIDPGYIAVTLERLQVLGLQPRLLEGHNEQTAAD